MPVEYCFLASDEALESFIRSWLTGTLPGAEFGHAAHVAVCACMACRYRGEELALEMKNELVRFLAGLGIASTPDSGYHETLTRFWCALVEETVEENASPLDAARKAVAIYGEDRLATQRYYSYDVLKSREARQRWLAPDLAATDWTTRQNLPEPPLTHRASE